MRHSYDREADAIYIHLSEEPYSWGQDLDDARRLDFGPSGKPRGIELLGVSSGVDSTDLPEQEVVESLLGRLGIKLYATGSPAATRRSAGGQRIEPGSEG